VLGASAVTFGTRVFLSRAASMEISSGSEDARRIVAHELAHVGQYARDGFVPFLYRYVADYLSGRFRGLSHFDAYAAIPYEQEAQLAEKLIADS
jgi:hypothetical protein